MSYAEAMERYGIDRPDLRYGLELFDASEVFRAVDFGVTRAALEQGGRVRAIVVPGGATLSRKQVDDLEPLAKSAGAGGLLWFKRANGALEGKSAKFLQLEQAERMGARDGDLVLLAAGPDRITSPALDRVRQEVARRLNLIPEGRLEFVWVLDFPSFERDPASGALTAVHHPFTAPHPEDLDRLETAPETVRAQAYDVVLNGLELGGGSIRIADPAL